MADKLMDLSKLEPYKNPRYYSNDIGNSNLFADFYKSIARYVPERKKWFVYNPTNLKRFQTTFYGNSSITALVL